MNDFDVEFEFEPLRQLTEEEIRDLRRRKNAPGGHRAVVDDSERVYLDTHPPIRDPAAVEQLVRDLTDYPAPDSDFYQAIIQTLDFAYGRRPRGPLSDEAPKSQPPTGGDLYHEEAVAARYIEGRMVRDTPLPRSRDFAVGVEHTCMWLRCATGDPPWGELGDS